MNFTHFKFSPQVADAIAAAGYCTPTPIQHQAIPVVMQGIDVIGLAQTGTGKTAAFALPMLDRLLKKPQRHIRGLVIAPTRELAEQIHEDIQTLGAKTNLRSMTLYGGVGLNPQIQKLKKGAHIIVACPGRLLDHINRGNLDFSGLEMLILDEADLMLDMGFIPDIRKIVRHLPKERQSLMFSATMRPEIKQLAAEMLHHPVTIQVGHTAPADTVSHTHFPVTQNLKTPLLLKILHDTPMGAVLIFTRTKHGAKRLSEVLIRAGYGSASLQGNLSQGRRQAALDGFRTGKFQILVATDIAARGIDVSKVSHVVNYDVPNTPEAYIHRIGRTGRAEQIGKAFNLITHEDQLLIRSIDKILGSPVEQRILPDFDYGQLVRPAVQKQMPSPHSRRYYAKPVRKP